AGNEIFAHLNTVANETALAVQRLTGAHAVVAFDAQVEIHNEQRIGLQEAKLAAFLEQIRYLLSDSTLLFVAFGDDLAHLHLHVREMPAQVEKVGALDFDELAFPGGEYAGPTHIGLEQRHLAEIFTGAQVRDHPLAA